MEDIIVVPDSITPVVGWKTLNCESLTGKLYSPNFPMVWPPKEPVEARCLGNYGEYRWQAVKTDLPNEPELEHHAGAYYTTTSFYYPLSTPTKKISPPAILLPPGYAWSYDFVAREHDCPSSECRCGIYLASDREVAITYAGDFLVEAYGWGKVVEHTGGYRVQYSYPKQIIANGKTTEKQLESLKEYGVPIVHSKRDNPSSVSVVVKRKRSESGVSFDLIFVIIILISSLIITTLGLWGLIHLIRSAV